MKGKLTLSLLSIAAILLLSSIISVLEYSRMSSYVSELIAADVNSINVARKLADVSNEYNLELLAVIGDESLTALPDFDAASFMAHCDSLRSSISSGAILPLADSVEYSYSAYMLTSLELPEVLKSDFIDSRTWFFERLQPRYNRLRQDIDNLSSVIYQDLKSNSETFDAGFYRSIIPGIVAVGVGLLLVLMLLFFILVYYVTPLEKILSGLNDYRSFGKQYNFEFEGDDQLHEINDGVAELTRENTRLHKRISALKNES